MKYKVIGTLTTIALLVLAMPVTAQSEAEELTADITTELIAVAIDPAGFDYGIVRSGGNMSPESPAVTITNAGNIDEIFEIKGSNATGGSEGTTEWTLSNVSDVDQYIHLAALEGQNMAGEGVPLETEFRSIGGVIAPEGTLGTKYAEVTPTAITDPGTYSTTIYVRALGSP